MSNEDNKDDEATVVIDIKNLKKEFETVGTDDLENLEFLADSSNPNIQIRPKVAVFDFKSNTFKTLIQKQLIPNDVQIINELPDLNTFIKENKGAYIIFNYHVESKAISTLLGQIKKIDPTMRTILMAKGLTPAAIEKHKNSPSGAYNYLNFPFTKQDLMKMLEM